MKKQMIMLLFTHSLISWFGMGMGSDFIYAPFDNFKVRSHDPVAGKKSYYEFQFQIPGHWRFLTKGRIPRPFAFDFRYLIFKIKFDGDLLYQCDCNTLHSENHFADMTEFLFPEPGKNTCIFYNTATEDTQFHEGLMDFKILCNNPDTAGETDPIMLELNDCFHGVFWKFFSLGTTIIQPAEFKSIKLNCETNSPNQEASYSVYIERGLNRTNISDISIIFPKETTFSSKNLKISRTFGLNKHVTLEIKNENELILKNAVIDSNKFMFEIKGIVNPKSKGVYLIEISGRSENDKLLERSNVKLVIEKDTSNLITLYLVFPILFFGMLLAFLIFQKCRNKTDVVELHASFNSGFNLSSISST
jgi:hypothetical protein